MSTVRDNFESILEAVRRACVDYYGERLISLAVYGSVARGTMRPDSDIDLLLVVNPLPLGRAARLDEFEAAERCVAPALSKAERAGVHTFLAPVFKTPADLERGSPLFLDMTDQVRILHDRNDTLRGYLARLEEKMKTLGARRVYRGGGYYWDLKPDFRWGDHIEL